MEQLTETLTAAQQCTQDYEKDAAFSISIPENSGYNIINPNMHYLHVYKDMDMLPYSWGNNPHRIKFSDTVWDFSPFKKTGVPDSKLKINFGLIPEPFRDDIKFYTIREINRQRAKIQTIKGTIQEHIAPFMNFAYEQGCRSIIEFDDKMIEAYFEKVNEKIALEGQRSRKKFGVKAIVDFYSSYYEDISSILPSEAMKTNTRLIRAQSEQNKTPDIPSDYFDLFLNRMLTIALDPERDVFYRSMACFYLIMSQTGLRIHEILALGINNLGEEKFADGRTMNYLRYPTSKGLRALPVYKTEYTYSNEITTLAFKMVLRIQKKERDALKTEYLFASIGDAKVGSNPVSSDKFSTAAEKFFRHLNTKKFKTMGIPIEGNEILYRKTVWSGGKKQPLFYPSATMFRVHMCTTLRANGVEQEVVERFMGHIAKEMRDYYYRKEDTYFQEDMGFTVRFLRELVDPDVKLLGGSKINAEAIRDFINSKKNLPVYRSLDDLVLELAKHLIIRPKTHGVCITVPDHACGEVIAADKYFCLNGTCLNEYHNYSYLPANWQWMKEAIRCAEIAFEKGRIREMEKQVNFLVRFVKTRMIPDLADYDRMVSVKGLEVVIGMHPDLIQIVEERNYINMEVERWRDMTRESFIESRTA